MWITLLSIVLVAPATSSQQADSDPQEHENYSNRQERRELGLDHKIGNHFRWAGTLEAEFGKQLIGKSRSSKGNRNLSLQLVAGINFTDNVELELSYEYEEQLSSFRLDESILSVSAGPLSLELGRFAVPFGAYNSYFIESPITSFAEVLGDSVVLGIELQPSTELQLFSSQSTNFLNRKQIAWGIALEQQVGDIEFGAGYLSDLALSEDIVEEFDSDCAENSNSSVFACEAIPAANAHVAISVNRVVVLAEGVAALKNTPQTPDDRRRIKLLNTDDDPDESSVESSDDRPTDNQFGLRLQYQF